MPPPQQRGDRFFQLRCSPEVLAARAETRLAAQVWRAYQHLDQLQWLPPEQLQEYQLQRLRKLLVHCAEQVPYYRDSLRSAGIRPEDLRSLADLRHIPILSRRTYQERFADFEAKNLPPGTVALEARATSGTGGIPISVRQTNVVVLWWLAFFLRDLEWARIDPRGSLASIRTLILPDDESRRRSQDGLALPYWSPALANLIETGPSFGMDLAIDPRRQLQWLRQIQPNYLLSYPSNLDYLGSLVRDEAAAIPSLKKIQIISESLPDDVRRRIESAFGVPVVNLYSCAEAGYIASPCPNGGGLHVHAENVILEVIDEAGEPCSPGQTGRVVLTTLHNFLGPFVRYEILDEATVAAPCSCGRGLPLLSQVGGKHRPMFWLPDGRRKSSMPLVEASRKLGGMRQLQIIQHALEHVEIRIVPNSDWSAEHVGKVQKYVHEFFGQPIRVDVQVFDRLPRSSGGKLQEVINELER